MPIFMGLRPLQFFIQLPTGNQCRPVPSERLVLTISRLVKGQLQNKLQKLLIKEPLTCCSSSDIHYQTPL